MCYDNCPNFDKRQERCRGGECPPEEYEENAASNGEAYRQEALRIAKDIINQNKQVAA